MQFLQRWKNSPLNDLLVGMAPGTRILAASLVAVILACVGWLALSEPTPERAVILGFLSKDEISKAVDAFHAAGLNDYQFTEANRIQVPAAERSLYLAALRDGGALPKQWEDIINASVVGNLLEPSSVRQKKIEIAREQAFATHLESLPQIVSAAVDFDELSNGFASQSYKVCSIQLKGLDNRPIETRILKNVVQHATTHFAGLEVRNVSVMDLGTGDVYQEGLSSPSMGENPFLAAQMEWETHYTGKVRELLSPYGDVKIAVSVQLDSDAASSTGQAGQESGSVVTQRTVTRKTTNRRDSATERPSGLMVRLFSNGPLTLDQTEEYEEVRSQRDTPPVIAQTTPPLPKQVRISVGIPESYYLKVLRHRHRYTGQPSAAESVCMPTAEQLAELRREVAESVEAAVAGLCMLESQASDRLVNVYSYTDWFVDDAVPLDFAQLVAKWLQQPWVLWSLLGTTVATLLGSSLWMRISYRRPARRLPLDLETSTTQLTDELELSPAELLAEEAAPGNLATTEARTDLSQLVRENPQATAAILKQWLEAA